MNGHPGGEAHTRRMITLAALPNGASVLDMGAGSGEAVRLMQALGYDAHGIDLEPRSDEVMQGDFLRLPYPDGHFDAVLSQCAFFVSGEVSGALREAHRALKPGGKLVLLDLGAAKDLSGSSGQSSQVVASHGFSPLEQYREHGNIGPWTDVYAMCATIFYCVRGKALPTAVERVSGVRADFSAFSPAVAAVLEKGLAVRPEDRIQSMGELRAALKAAIAPGPGPEPSPKPRLPLILAAAAVSELMPSPAQAKAS